MLVFVQVIYNCSLYIVYSYRFGYGVFLIQQDNRVLVGKYNDNCYTFLGLNLFNLVYFYRLSLYFVNVFTFENRSYLVLIL